MKDRLEITSLEQLRALAHPMRWRVIRLIAGEGPPLSVKQMADRLEEPHSKIHYHVRQLVKAGFLEQVGEHLVNGIIERFYQVSARSIEVGAAIRELPGHVSVSRSVGRSLFDGVQEVYDEAFRENRSLQVQFQQGYLTPAELNALIDHVAREMKAHATPRPGARHVRWVTIATMPEEAGGE